MSLLDDVKKGKVSDATLLEYLRNPRSAYDIDMVSLCSLVTKLYARIEKLEAKKAKKDAE